MPLKFSFNKGLVPLAERALKSHPAALRDASVAQSYLDQDHPPSQSRPHPMTA